MPDKQPDVEIASEIEDQDELSQVVVDLAKKPEDKQADQKQTEAKADEKSSKEIAKLNNTIAYQNRKLDQAMRELKEAQQKFESRQQTVQQTQQPQNINDPDFDPEINAVAEQNWQKGVTKLYEKKIVKDLEVRVQEALDKREHANKELVKKQTLNADLEKSKQKVLEKYPQIEDDNSEESSLYRQVINEDISILSNVHGPEIAMYRMEERMRQMGKTPPSVKPIIDREVNRLARAGASSVIGRQVSKDGKITLTKEQQAFCDHYKIPYEQYAKNLKAGEVDGGVEI